MSRYQTTGKLRGRCVVPPPIPEWTEEMEEEQHKWDEEHPSEDEDESSEEEGEEGEEEEETKEGGEEGEGDSSSDEETDYDDWEDAEVHECIFRLSHQYHLRELLNEGEHHCYLAFHRGRSVVIKLSPPLDSGRAPKEVRILLRLKGHPHIQELIAWYRIKEFYATVSPEYPYTSFRRIFKAKAVDGELPEAKQARLQNDQRRMRSFFRQLFETLAFIHERGVIHRDIKPSNLMWHDEKEWLTVIDFDVSTFDREEGKGHTRKIGTKPYRAPEVVEQRPYGNKVDMYSAGVLFAQAMYGASEDLNEETLDHKNVKKWIKRLRRQKKGRKAFNATKDLALRLLNYDPKRRPTAQEVLQHAYFQAEKKET